MNTNKNNTGKVYILINYDIITSLYLVGNNRYD